MSSPGPQSDGRMKAMEPGAAPMISFPAGIIKEFITSSPSPPAASLVNTEGVVDSPKAPTQTRTPSPDLPNMLNDSAALPTDTSNHVNGVMANDKSENTNTSVVSDSSNDKNISVTVPATADTSDSTKSHSDSKLPVVNGDVPEKRLNGIVGPSLKRPSEEPEGYPDLKKVRVFAEDKNKSVESSVQEFNKHLDQESKKLGDDQDEIMCLSSDNSSVNLAKPEEKTSFDSQKSSAILTSITACETVPGTPPDLKSKLEETKSETKTDSKTNIDVEKENLSNFTSDLEVLTPSKESHVPKDEKSKISGGLRKLSRKGLEKIIMHLFSEKTLYKSELGQQKQLCEKLETTLEANRKKTAQFHKEIEDLKKVTNRLSVEQQSRKGQFVAPIRIKRSVGIQAAPHIINKGLQHAQNSAIKTISPRTGAVKVGSQGRVLPPNVTFQTKMIPSNSPNKVTGGPVGGMLSTSQQGGRLSGMSMQTVTTMTKTMANTSVPLNTVAQPGNIGTVRPAMGQMLMMAQAPPGMTQTIPRPAGGGLAVTTNKVMVPLVQGKVVPISNIIPSGNILNSRQILYKNKENTATTNAVNTPLVSRGTGIVDLTADEGRAAVGRNSTVMSTPGTLVKVPVSGGSTQLVTIPPNAGVVLLPNSSTGTTALVSGVPTINNPVMAQARTGLVSTPRAMNTAYRPISTATTTGSSLVPQHRHPAPLPRTPVQQVAGITKKLPPQPTLKLSHKENSIVLSWTMAKTEDHETIASYQLYAYQEGNSPPSAALWKKVGSVKALELPMACTLTQFMPGHIYHFAVRAVDIKSRLGPFSDPRSIRLEKNNACLLHQGKRVRSKEEHTIPLRATDAPTAYHTHTKSFRYQMYDDYHHLAHHGNKRK